MTTIETKSYKIHFTPHAYKELNSFIASYKPSKIFILVDDNTLKLCLPKFIAQLHVQNSSLEILEITSGENHKTINSCVNIWQELSKHLADRHSLLINLGGGVVTDLGGFVASTYMRGITFINIPTTILAMVDASVGGKTGIDLGHLKNQVGVFNDGKMVIVDPSYLTTLPKQEVISGFAEMLKHALIADENYWNSLRRTKIEHLINNIQAIHQSIKIKHRIVNQDPSEKGLRKVLNFGHTLGHAIESYFLDNPNKTLLLHGEAIAIGLVLESYISTKLCGLSADMLEDITATILSVFKKIELSTSDINSIIDLLKYDKKNNNGKVNFVLLEEIGRPKINCQVDNTIILDSFEYYKRFHI